MFQGSAKNLSANHVLMLCSTFERDDSFFTNKVISENQIKDIPHIPCEIFAKLLTKIRREVGDLDVNRDFERVKEIIEETTKNILFFKPFDNDYFLRIIEAEEIDILLFGLERACSLLEKADSISLTMLTKGLEKTYKVFCEEKDMSKFIERCSKAFHELTRNGEYGKKLIDEISSNKPYNKSIIHQYPLLEDAIPPRKKIEEKQTNLYIQTEDGAISKKMKLNNLDFANIKILNEEAVLELIKKEDKKRIDRKDKEQEKMFKNEKFINISEINKNNIVKNPNILEHDKSYYENSNLNNELDEKLDLIKNPSLNSKAINNKHLLSKSKEVYASVKTFWNKIKSFIFNIAIFARDNIFYKFFEVIWFIIRIPIFIFEFIFNFFNS